MMRHPCCASDLRAVAWFAVLTTLLIAATSDHFSVGPRGTIVSTPHAESKTPARMASVGDETDPTSFFGSAAISSDSLNAAISGGGGIFAGDGDSKGFSGAGDRATEKTERSMSSAWDSAPQDPGSSPTSSHQPSTDGNLHKSGPSSFQTTAGGAVLRFRPPEDTARTNSVRG